MRLPQKFQRKSPENEYEIFTATPNVNPTNLTDYHIEQPTVEKNAYACARKCNLTEGCQSAGFYVDSGKKMC
mgnify:CR=1 FL=1